jgi:IS30 family transposase
VQKLAVSLCHNHITNIQTKTLMQVKKRIINNWLTLKEKGDIEKIAKITGKQPSTISRVISGKQETTPDVVEQIVAYFKPRKKQISKIEAEA